MIKEWVDQHREHDAVLGVPENKQTFFLGHDTAAYTGVLIIHGFLANPLDTKVVAQHLHDEKKVDVLSIRLPGHGSSEEDLKDRRWSEWLDTAREAYHKLLGSYERVMIYGISMGALIGIQLSIERPPTGLICLGTALIPADWRIRWGGPFGQLIPSIMSRLFKIDYVKNDVREELKGIVYERVPAKAATEFYALVLNTIPKLSQLTCPLLVLHSQEDEIALPESAKKLYHLAGSETKKLVWSTGHHTFLTHLNPQQQPILDLILYWVETCGIES